MGKLATKTDLPRWMGIPLLALFALQDSAEAQTTFATSDAADLTYARDVAPIIQDSCLVCHRPGGIGPMDFVTYDDVRRYSRRIREQVENRLMPPYYYDDDVGIQELQHDWRLSEQDIATVVAWVDQGAPLGDPDDMPPPPELPDTDEWSFAPTLGAPHVIVPSTPIDVPADGLDLFHFPYVATEVTEDRCIRALQVKPRGDAQAVVHHANTTFQLQGEDGSFSGSSDDGAHATEYAMGKLGELVPDGVCRVLPADAWVRWDIHLYPGGLGAQAPGAVIEDNVVELGIWLHPPDYEYRYQQDLLSYSLPEGELLIPPAWDHDDAGLQDVGPPGTDRQLPAARAPAHALGVPGDPLPGDGPGRGRQHGLELERGLAPEPHLRAARGPAATRRRRADHEAVVRQHGGQSERHRPADVGRVREPDGRRDVAHVDRGDPPGRRGI